jgi:hypothetical protein
MFLLYIEIRGTTPHDGIPYIVEPDGNGASCSEILGELQRSQLLYIAVLRRRLFQFICAIGLLLNINRKLI